jgi:hypothetical protein
MLNFQPKRLLSFVTAFLIAVFAWSIAPVAQAYDNPDLLPDHFTPVIDLADSLTDIQQQALENQLNDFEAETGWKLRVLTQFDRTPGRAVKEFWSLDDRSVMLVADPRGAIYSILVSGMPSSTCCHVPSGLSCKRGMAISFLFAKTGKIHRFWRRLGL